MKTQQRAHRLKLLKNVAREIKLLSSSTKMEKLCWWYFRNTNLQFNYQQHFEQYCADFYFPVAKTILEVDGLTHLTEEAREHDMSRDSYIYKTFGVKTLRIFDTDLVTLEGVERLLRAAS